MKFYCKRENNFRLSISITQDFSSHGARRMTGLWTFHSHFFLSENTVTVKLKCFYSSFMYTLPTMNDFMARLNSPSKKQPIVPLTSDSFEDFLLHHAETNITRARDTMYLLLNIKKRKCLNPATRGATLSRFRQSKSAMNNGSRHGRQCEPTMLTDSCPQFVLHLCLVENQHQTRSSATADGPRDALCQSKSCQP